MKRAKKRIAIFQFDLGIGGVQKSLINMLNALDYNLYSIDLYIVKTDIFFVKSLPKEVALIAIDGLPTYARLLPFNIVKTLYSSRFSHVATEYDIAIDFNGYQHVTALGATSIAAKRRIAWFHGNLVERQKSDKKYKLAWYLQKQKFNYFNKAVAVSKGIVDGIIWKTPFEEKDITVIGNYLDTKEIIRLSKEGVKLNIDKSLYNLVSVGRLAYEKGVDITIETFAEINEEYQDAKLYIIGDGPERERLIKKTTDLKLADKVVFLGAQSNPYAFMARMDGFISTSRNEGQGISILEAKCLGLDLFIAKHLEAFTYEVRGFKDLTKAIVSAKKNEIKSLDSLGKYNEENTRELNRILYCE